MCIWRSSPPSVSVQLCFGTAMWQAQLNIMTTPCNIRSPIPGGIHLIFPAPIIHAGYTTQLLASASASELGLRVRLIQNRTTLQSFHHQSPQLITLISTISFALAANHTNILYTCSPCLSVLHGLYIYWYFAIVHSPVMFICTVFMAIVVCCQSVK